MRFSTASRGLILAGILIALAFAAAPTSAPSQVQVRASAVNFNLNYSDPASDVFVLYTANNTHLTDAAGNWIYTNTQPQVNILRLFSVDAGASVGVYLRIQGGSAISNLPNTSYEVHLYTRLDNSTHYILHYSNRTATLRSNLTGSTVVNLSANATIGPTYQLGFAVSKADLGTVTEWNIDGTAKMVGANYTFEDFGWLQPGSPGSAPAFLQGRVTDAADGAGLAGVNVSAGAAGAYTTTNATGYYVLPAAPGNYTLTFSLSGYGTVSKTVTVQYQQTQTVNAQLSKSTAALLTSPYLWVVVVVVAVALIAGILILRGRKPTPPKANPPP